LETVAGGLLAIGDDAAAARDLARPQIALYVGGMGAKGKNFYNDLAVAYGYEEAAARIQELYLAGKKKEAEAAVPDEFCELMSLCGPAGYVRERVEAFREAGVTMLNVTPVGPEPAKSIETVKGWL
uniref:LLM class flavin-dependent oxidoreductase n=1 Tax=Streptomyces sp. KL118A TaxID=3045153 RepID=UPI00278C45E7